MSLLIIFTALAVLFLLAGAVFRYVSECEMDRFRKLHRNILTTVEDAKPNERDYSEPDVIEK